MSEPLSEPLHEPLSVREQHSFISAYRNLFNEKNSRINKSDINTVEKTLNKCDAVQISDLLMSRMESCPRDPAALDNIFRKLFDKLEAQKPNIHKKEETQLTNIQQKLAPVVEDIHAALQETEPCKAQLSTVTARQSSRTGAQCQNDVEEQFSKHE